MAALTRRVLRRVDGLFADASRDIELAKKWGLRPGTPTLVAPGAGHPEERNCHCYGIVPLA